MAISFGRTAMFCFCKFFSLSQNRYGFTLAGFRDVKSALVNIQVHFACSKIQFKIRQKSGIYWFHIRCAAAVRFDLCAR